MNGRFAAVPSRYDALKLEQKVLDFWRREEIFERTLKRSADRPLFTFNEGPPTANGKPGLHHVLARSFKDLYPRYKTMRGFHCPRKAGWDAHGLPVEHEVEKSLGIFDKQEIERRIGIRAFNQRCRESVQRYIKDWEQMTERMGFWVDLQQAYSTLENDYIESVWSLLKTIWDRGWIYRDYKVVPYDPRIGATLSAHEVALGYRSVRDPSLFVRFPLQGQPETSLLAWTTTPWTLPSHMVLGVDAQADYAWVELERTEGGGMEQLILAEALREKVLQGRAHRVCKIESGAALVGLNYRRPFEFLAECEAGARVVAADFVRLEEGTGIVHLSPAYGADDMRLCRSLGLPIVHALGLDGCFLPEVEPVAGRFFKDADAPLTASLRERGLLFREETLEHNYPHGWRTGDPLIFYAKEAWYIRTSNLRERMVQLNQTIRWVPETIRDGRFGHWLEQNVDWALSRERFWGTPLPIWTDGEGHYHCVGSRKELEQLSGCTLKGVDLHRPSIDAITFPDPESGVEMRRVPEVIDCWFDSGAMPYAQWHYPFENQERFARHFPADYICEAIDQTRGWFYTMHAIAAMVSDQVAFRNVICLSHIVDQEGRKMSKSLGNTMDVNEIFGTCGADALRWHFLARVLPEGQKRMSLRIVQDVVSGFLNTYWNIYAFFVTYANLDTLPLERNPPAEALAPADRWILALLQHTVHTATEALDDYDAHRAGSAIERFVGQLSNWYIRRNRRRFWKSGLGADKGAAHATLYTCLHTVNRLIAPFAPFLAETVYGNLERSLYAEAPQSVHMTSWPEIATHTVDTQLIAQVDLVQRVVSLGRAARNTCGHRVRQPLARLLLRLPDAQARQAIEAHAQDVREELNVKQIEYLSPDDVRVRYRLRPVLRALGRRYGARLPAIREALQRCDPLPLVAAASRGEAFDVLVAGETLRLEADEVLIDTVSTEGYVSAEEGGLLAALDTRLDAALLQEGLLRELIRGVQGVRKQASLHVEERIVLRIRGSALVEEALKAHRAYLMAETLTERWAEENAAGHATSDFVPAAQSSGQLGAEHWEIELSPSR